MIHILSRCLYLSYSIQIYMINYLKKPNFFSKLSNGKKIIILIISCIIVLGGLTPSINSLIINNKKPYQDDVNNDNSDIKKTELENEVIAYASFQWTPRYPDPGEKITFSSTSHAYNGFIFSENWYIENSHVAMGNRCEYTFDIKGTYIVTLRVSARGYHGSFDYDTITHYVGVGADPFPQITITPKNPAPGEVVTIDGSGSTDPDGSIVSYNWSFYEISRPNNITNLGTGETISYKWDDQGIYNLMLNVVDDKGNNNTYELKVFVSILKIDNFDSFSREIKFEIENQGNINAKNVNWKIGIEKYSLFGIRSRVMYQKSDTIDKINSKNSEDIKIKNLRRAFCKIKVNITAEGDNAIKVSKTLYGVVFGKFVYLSEDNFISPYAKIAVFGIIFTMIILFLYPFFKNVSSFIFHL